MANEGNVNFNVTCTKSNRTIQENRSFQFDIDSSLDTPLSDELVVTATSAAAGIAISPAGLTQARWMMIENTDDAESVHIGGQDAGTFAGLWTLLAGESMIAPLKASATVYCQRAGSADVKLQVRAIDNGA